MNGRWRSVRERLAEGVSIPGQTDGWDRVIAGRAAGGAVTLPARDRRARPGVVVGLFGAGMIAFGFMQLRQPVVHAVATEPSGTLDGWDWLVPAAYAQAAVPSSLPPIDPVDLSRFQPGRWVYSRRGGVDGVITGTSKSDTIRVARVSEDDGHRVVIVRTVPQRRSVDSLVFLNERPRAQRVVTSRQRDPDARIATMETTVRPDTIAIRLVPATGAPPRTHEFPGSWPVGVEDFVPQLMPGFALEDGYARSLNLLDLLGGETRNVGRPYELRVVGRESVQTPAGSFDCWVIELKTTSNDFNRVLHHQLKVARNSGVLIQARWDEWNGFFREQELVAYQE